MEQDLINKNVFIDVENGCASANLPFLADPDTRLVTNDWTARKIFDSQVKKLSKSEKDRKDALASEQKLQNLGDVDWLSNLDDETIKLILTALVRYFIPWRIVWSKSLSTPVTLFQNSVWIQLERYPTKGHEQYEQPHRNHHPVDSARVWVSYRCSEDV